MQHANGLGVEESENALPFLPFGGNSGAESDLAVFANGSLVDVFCLNKLK